MSEVRKWRDANISELCEEKIRDLVITIAAKTGEIIMAKASDFKCDRAGPRYVSSENYNQGCIDVQQDFYKYLLDFVTAPSSLNVKETKHD